MGVGVRRLWRGTSVELQITVWGHCVRAAAHAVKARRGAGNGVSGASVIA